jgi:hypothetical protein
MNKEVLLALIDKDINELAVLNKGFAESDTLSPTILELAKSKAENIVAGLIYLKELQVITQPEKICPPKPVVIPEKTKPNPEIVSKPEVTPVLEKLEIISESTVSKKEKPMPIAEPVMMESAIDESPKQSLAEVLNAEGHSLNDDLAQKTEPSLATVLSNSKIEDLRQALSLAERFRFQRELFHGNGEKLNTTLTVMNGMKSEAEALKYLSSFGWSDEDTCATEFRQLISRKFL